MEKIEISIDINNIKERVQRESGTIAKARSGAGVADSLADMLPATDDENDIIEKNISAKLNGLMTLIGRYMPACRLATRENNGETGHTVTVIVPHNYPNANGNKIKKCIEEILFCSTMQEWALLIKPDEAGIYTEKTNEATVQLRTVLAERKRPAMKNGSKENIIEL